MKKMNDIEILRQIIDRSINNAISAINPAFKIFSNTLVNYTMEFITPYVEAFTNPDTSHVNIKAAGEYLKEETNQKIEEFMKKFSDKLNEV